MCDGSAVGVELILNLVMCIADKADGGQQHSTGSSDCCFCVLI